ncbi:MAG: hypothetical protein HY067_21885 [Betaproteobacteria bacterium]|nr:hypothetical protein [Betaproteobacteria bacterium]
MSKPQEIELAALEQVGILLKFSAENAKSISPDIVATIASAWEARDTSTWTPEVSSKFWGAFNTLCSIIKPVSLDTMSSNSLNRQRRSWVLWWRLETTSLAKSTARNYLSILLIALFASICLQFIVATAANLSAEIDKIVAADEQIANKISQGLTSLGGIPAEEDFAKIKLSPEQKKTIIDINNEFEKMWFDTSKMVTKLQLFGYLTSFGLIDTGFQPGDLTHPTNLTGMNREILAFFVNRRWITETQEKGMMVIKVINVTFLPLLLGLIGACAYVTRLISDQIKDTTFSNTSPVRHQVRVALGALSGVVVGFGWIGSGISLSPVALAFVAGYSIEPVFATIDSIAEKFRK